MRKWGIVISVFYAVIVFGILIPFVPPLILGNPLFPSDFLKELQEFYGYWLVWIPIVAVLSGQAILLFLSVDSSFRRLRPRTHIAVTCVAASMLFALLIFAVVCCLGSAVAGDKFGNGYLDTEMKAIGCWVALWALWGIAFYLYFRNSTQVTARAVSWLLKGSVLELLIAVPCHVWVRRREECCAPLFTSFGIVTGIAVMLLSFGPSVLLLYKKRLDAYAARKPA